MFLVTVKNFHTGTEEVHACYHLTYGENALGFPNKECKQVHLYEGTFNRADSCIVIETNEPVKIEPFWDIESRPNGY